ncbi:hypothetical protein FS837_009281 [Tulasnella sp. UAMH 9824]|nr:hypothetical protein FS837_009281 [Tulasnella sp. UAMH 9824]
MSGPSLPRPKGEEFSPPPQQMDSAPELPRLIAPDIVSLFVLPHSSGDTSVDGVNMSSFDFDRLAFLGTGAIQYAITTYLFDQDKFSSVEVDALRRGLTQPETWAQWASLYGNFADLGHGLSDEVTESARIFSAYVGGLYQQDGIETIKTWIQELILHTPETTSLNSPIGSPKGKGVAIAQEAIAGPSSSGVSSPKLQHASTGYGTSRTPTQTPSQSRKRGREADSGDEGQSSLSQKRTRLSSSATSPAGRRVGSGSPTPSVQPTPSIPILGQVMTLSGLLANHSSASSSRSLTPAGSVRRASLARSIASSSTPAKKWVSVLNEAVMALKLNREWGEESLGADHVKIWRATLALPEMGITATGEGTTKKAAQEEAARQVCKRMNWTQDYKW